MNVRSRISSLIDSQKFLGYLLALILSTLLLGFAPASIAVGIFVFFSIRYAIINRQKQPIDFKLLLPIALYLLFVSSLFWTVDGAQTLKGLGRTVVLLLIPVAFNLIPKFTSKSFNLIFKFFTNVNIIIGVFFLVTAIIRYLQSSFLDVFTYHDLVSSLELNAIYVSLVFSMSLFYLLSKQTKSSLDIIKIIFFITLEILLSSKIMLFVLTLSPLVYLILYGINNLKLLSLIILGTIFIALGSKIPIDRFLFEKETKVKEVWTNNEFGHVYMWTGTSIRLLQLRILKDQIKDEGIFWRGFGLYASRNNIKQRHMEFDTYPGFHDYNYHNQYAQILAETGIIGLAILLSILGVLFRSSINSRNFLFIMFSFTITLLFFSETLLWRQSGLFLFIILYCLLNRTIFPNKLFISN